MSSSHSTAISGDRWPDHVRLSDIEPLFVCQECGHRGADVRPLFDRERMPVSARHPQFGQGLGKGTNRPIARLNPRWCYKVFLVSWDRPFDQPVPMPRGAAARTLRDAANYIKEMPKSERDKAEWRLVIQMLIDAAEDVAPMLFAKWAILYAVEQSFNPALNDPYWRRRKPMRYR